MWGRGGGSGVEVYGTSLRSRLLLRTSGYPSPAVLAKAVESLQGADRHGFTAPGVQPGERGRAGLLVADPGAGRAGATEQGIGYHSVQEAVTTAHMAREVFGTPWIKLEVIGEDDTLQPDVFGLVEATRILTSEGFQVYFPTPPRTCVVADRLLDAGCRVLMPWGAPIGSGRGLNNLFGLKALRAHFSDIPLVIDAGIGVPSHAAQAMELGFDAVLLNTAVAQAADPARMAAAFAAASDRGGCRGSGSPGPMEPRRIWPHPSTPVIGTAFLK